MIYALFEPLLLLVIIFNDGYYRQSIILFYFILFPKLSYAVCRELKQEVKKGRLGSRKISTIKPGFDYFFQKYCSS